MNTYCSNIVELPNPIESGAYLYRLRSAPRPRLVWLRAIEDLYNPQLAVEVLAELVRDFPDISLAMYGPAKSAASQQRLEQRAAGLGVTDRVRLIGPITKAEIPAALDQGDIFLNTTNVDNTPVSIVEAMASGMCIVTTNVGGIPHLVKDEETGLLVPPMNAPAMAAAIRRLLLEPGLGGRLSRNAREKAEQFDWSRILPCWEEQLGSLAK